MADAYNLVSIPFSPRARVRVVFLTGARVLCLQAQKADLLILTVGEDSVNTDDGDIESLELSPSQVLSRA